MDVDVDADAEGKGGGKGRVERKMKGEGRWKGRWRVEGGGRDGGWRGRWWVREEKGGTQDRGWEGERWGNWSWKRGSGRESVRGEGGLLMKLKRGGGGGGGAGWLGVRVRVSGCWVLIYGAVAVGYSRVDGQGRREREGWEGRGGFVGVDKCGRGFGQTDAAL